MEPPVQPVTPDYYTILAVNRGCSTLSIKRAYRKAALKYHPDRHYTLSDSEQALPFHEVQKAFDVLSDPKLRARYDGWLDQKVLERGPVDDVLNGPVHADNWPQHFGSVLSHSKPIDEFEPNDSDSAASTEAGKHKERARDVEQALVCTLEELYMGAHKRVTLEVRGQTVVTEVRIQPGFRHGTRLEFSETTFLPDVENAGTVGLILIENDHAYYRRDGDDLICTAKVPLHKALIGFTIHLTHLDGREISIKTDGPIAPGTVTTLPGEGMPVRNKGDVVGVGVLRVQFDVQFPVQVTPKQREHLRLAFDGDGNDSPHNTLRTEGLNNLSHLHATSFTVFKRALRRYASCPYPATTIAAVSASPSTPAEARGTIERTISENSGEQDHKRKRKKKDHDC